MTLVDNFHSPAWPGRPCRQRTLSALHPSRPSLSFAYTCIYVCIHALDKTTNSFFACARERRFLLQNRVIQFHEPRHVYYGEINYYVPDVSRHSFRARTGLFPFHYRRARAKSRIRGDRKISSRIKSHFVSYTTIS